MYKGFVYKPSPKQAWRLGSKRASARFGAVPLMPGGHGWDAHIPSFESQNVDGVESFACTVFACAKAWITLANRLKYTFPDNIAERFNAIMAGIVPPGANPHDVAESMRTVGMIENKYLPFDKKIKSTEAFYQPKPMPEELIAEAKKLVQKYEFGHETVFNDPQYGLRTLNKPAKLKEALSRGPVCVSVHAWKEDTQGLFYKDPTDLDQHWTFLVDYVEGEYWLVDDQYAPYEKKIRWETDFQTAEVYFLKENPTGIAPADKTYFRKMLQQMAEALKRLQLILQGK